MADKPLVYLILGAEGSGRREAIADLIEGGFDPGQAAVILAEGEGASGADSRLGKFTRWKLNTDGSIDAELPDAEAVFFVVHGRRDPIDQIEAFKAWLLSQPAELARIICVVHCQLAERHPALLHWYDACIHFSDVILLNRREGVANKWVSDFKARYKDQCYPCLIELIKSGHVANPALVLEPLALRISHAFDPETEWVAVGEEEGDEDEQEEGEEEVEMVPVEDPYFVRFQGGRREKEVPKIEKYLDLPGGAPT